MYGYNDEDFGPLATPGDAHREWHRNSGVPMGTPGCPQDACHMDDHDDPRYEPGDMSANAYCGLCGQWHTINTIRAEYATHYAAKASS